MVGICRADQRTSGLPVNFLWREAQRKGWRLTASRILARLAYLLANRRRDQAAHQRLYNEDQIDEVLGNWSGSLHQTENYSSPETLTWLQQMQPDILVAHTPYWIGKRVRQIPKSKIVLGGHPGITPDYRGSHSAFWAVYRGHPEDVGCTVFVLDEGVDTGDVVAQERIAIAPDDSFVTLGWKGMQRIAELQAEVLLQLGKGGTLPRRPVQAPPDSLFDQPTLGQYWRYRRQQSKVR